MSAECSGRFDDQLVELVYGELSDASARGAQTHLQTCERCSTKLNEMKRVRSLMQKLTPEPAPPKGLESLLAYARKETEKRQSAPQPRRWIGVLSFVSGLAVVAALVVWSMPKEAPPPLVVASGPSVSEPRAEPEVSTPPRLERPKRAASTAAPSVKESDSRRREKSRGVRGEPSSPAPAERERAGQLADTGNQQGKEIAAPSQTKSAYLAQAKPTEERSAAAVPASRAAGIRSSAPPADVSNRLNELLEAARKAHDASAFRKEAALLAEAAQLEAPTTVHQEIFRRWCAAEKALGQEEGEGCRGFRLTATGQKPPAPP